MQEQMLGGKGFLVIGYLLEKVCWHFHYISQWLPNLSDTLVLWKLPFPNGGQMQAGERIKSVSKCTFKCYFLLEISVVETCNIIHI